MILQIIEVGELSVLIFFSRIRRRAAYHCIKTKRVLQPREGKSYDKSHAHRYQSGTKEKKRLHASKGQPSLVLLPFETT